MPFFMRMSGTDPGAGVLRYYEGAESEQEVAAAPPKAWSLKMGSPQLKGASPSRVT